MTKRLINKRVFDEYRIVDKYYHVLIDATQLHSYGMEHIPGSLVTHYANGNNIYHNNVLLASLKAGNIVVPMDFEWLENSQTEYDKQDYELNGAKRLMKRIKKT